MGISLTRPTQATLAMVRDEANGPADLARYFRQSETWAAGLIHAVVGDDDFAFSAQIDDYHPTQAEMADYQTGFRFGVELIEREATADGWAECYAIAAVEALQAAEPMPMLAADCPF